MSAKATISPMEGNAGTLPLEGELEGALEPVGALELEGALTTTLDFVTLASVIKGSSPLPESFRLKDRPSISIKSAVGESESGL